MNKNEHPISAKEPYQICFQNKRLGACELAAAGCAVSRVPDGEVALEGGHVGLGEHL